MAYLLLIYSTKKIPVALTVAQCEKLKLQFGVYCIGTKACDALITQVHRFKTLGVLRGSEYVTGFISHHSRL